MVGKGTAVKKINKMRQAFLPFKEGLVVLSKHSDRGKG